MTYCTISVTKRDLADGKKHNPWRCAVARAAKRALAVRSWSSVSVGDGHLFAFLPAKAGRFAVPLPESVCLAIGRFDLGEPVEPFAFRLNLTEAALG